MPPLSRPKFEVQFSVTVRDAGPEDVTALLQQLTSVVGKEAIQVQAPVVMLPVVPTTPMLPERVNPMRKWYRRPDAAERKVIVLEALRAERWIVSKAAERLGIARETLRQWMRNLDIRAEDGREEPV